MPTRHGSDTQGFHPANRSAILFVFPVCHVIGTFTMISVYRITVGSLGTSYGYDCTTVWIMGPFSTIWLGVLFTALVGIALGTSDFVTRRQAQIPVITNLRIFMPFLWLGLVAGLSLYVNLTHYHGLMFSGSPESDETNENGEKKGDGGRLLSLLDFSTNYSSADSSGEIAKITDVSSRSLHVPILSKEEEKNGLGVANEPRSKQPDVCEIMGDVYLTMMISTFILVWSSSLFLTTMESVIRSFFCYEPDGKTLDVTERAIAFIQTFFYTVLIGIAIWLASSTGNTVFVIPVMCGGGMAQMFITALILGVLQANGILPKDGEDEANWNANNSAVNRARKQKPGNMTAEEKRKQEEYIAGFLERRERAKQYDRERRDRMKIYERAKEAESPPKIGGNISNSSESDVDISKPKAVLSKKNPSKKSSKEYVPSMLDKVAPSAPSFSSNDSWFKKVKSTPGIAHTVSSIKILFENSSDYIKGVPVGQTTAARIETDIFTKNSINNDYNVFEGSLEDWFIEEVKKSKCFEKKIHKINQITGHAIDGAVRGLEFSFGSNETSAGQRGMIGAANPSDVTLDRILNKIEDADKIFGLTIDDYNQIYNPERYALKGYGSKADLQTFRLEGNDFIVRIGIRERSTTANMFSNSKSKSDGNKKKRVSFKDKKEPENNTPLQFEGTQNPEGSLAELVEIQTNSGKIFKFVDSFNSLYLSATCSSSSSSPSKNWWVKEIDINNAAIYTEMNNAGADTSTNSPTAQNIKDDAYRASLRASLNSASSSSSNDTYRAKSLYLEAIIGLNLEAVEEKIPTKFKKSATMGAKSTSSKAGNDVSGENVPRKKFRIRGVITRPFKHNELDSIRLAAYSDVAGTVVPDEIVYKEEDETIGSSSVVVDGATSFGSTYDPAASPSPPPQPTFSQYYAAVD